MARHSEAGWTLLWVVCSINLLIVGRAALLILGPGLNHAGMQLRVSGNLDASTRTLYVTSLVVTQVREQAVLSFPGQMSESATAATTCCS